MIEINGCEMGRTRHTPILPVSGLKSNPKTRQNPDRHRRAVPHPPKVGSDGLGRPTSSGERPTGANRLFAAERVRILAAARRSVVRGRACCRSDALNKRHALAAKDRLMIRSERTAHDRPRTTDQGLRRRRTRRSAAAKVRGLATARRSVVLGRACCRSEALNKRHALAAKGSAHDPARTHPS